MKLKILAIGVLSFFTLTTVVSCNQEQPKAVSANDKSTEKEKFYFELDNTVINCSENQYYNDEWNDELISFQFKTNLPAKTKIIIGKGLIYNSAANDQDSRLSQIDTLIIKSDNFSVDVPPAYAANGYLNVRVPLDSQDESIRKAIGSQRDEDIFSTVAYYTYRPSQEKDKNGVLGTVFPLELVLDKKVSEL